MFYLVPIFTSLSWPYKQKNLNGKGIIYVPICIICSHSKRNQTDSSIYLVKYYLLYYKNVNKVRPCFPNMFI